MGGYLLFALIGAAAVRNGGAAAYVWLFLAALYPTGFIATGIHEFGHALATRSVGYRVFSITIGVGAALLSRTVGGVELTLASNPFRGGQILTLYGASTPRRWKRAVILLGGVAAEAMMAVPVFVVLAKLDDMAAGDGTGWTMLKVVVMALAANLALSVASNLLPRTIRRNGQLIGSDGKQLLGLLTDARFGERAVRSDALLTGIALYREKRMEDARTHFEAAWLKLGYPELMASLVDCTGKAMGPEAATQLYFHHADRLPPKDSFAAEWAFTMGNIAWHAVMSERPDWFELADVLSERASAICPEAPIRATRGAVLMLKGESLAGEAMVRDAISGCAMARDKAEFCDFLARRKLASGDAALGAEYARMSLHLAAAV